MRRKGARRRGGATLRGALGVMMGPALALALMVAACGGAQPQVVYVTATPSPTAPLPVAQATPTPSPAPEPALPTYPQVLSTYPAGAETCCTDARLSAVNDDGTWTLTGGKVCPGKSELSVAEGGTLVLGDVFFGGEWKCLGAKITVLQPVTIDGQDYAAGALLTLDKDGQWVQVSSWTQAPGQAAAPPAPQVTAPPAPQATAAEMAAAGEVVLLDRFDDNLNGWPLGNERNEYVTNDWRIGDGVYRWEAQAHEEMHWYVYPASSPMADVAASVQARQAGGTGWSSWGLAFRVADSDNFYFFAVNNQGEFNLRYKYRGEWGSLIDWQPAPGLATGAANRLAVLARGGHFSLWINDRLVAEVDDARIASGHVGLSIGMDGGSQVALEFDEFEVRRP